MEFKKIKFDNEVARFIVKNVNTAYVNAIRRYIINRVPTLAIEEIEFVENGSALYDEILANRLGLIPLTTDLKTFVEKDKCRCKGAGCAKCEVKLTLNKTGPCTVYAKDLNCKDPGVKAVYPDMPIVKLVEGQSLKFEAKAVLGNGKMHAKFSPGLAYYQGYPVFKIKQSKDASKAVAACPKKILELNKDKLKVVDELKCDLCKACEAVSNAISVKGSDKDFIFTLESWGQISTKEILSKAVEIFNEEIDELNKALSKVKS